MKHASAVTLDLPFPLHSEPRATDEVKARFRTKTVATTAPTFKLLLLPSAFTESIRDMTGQDDRFGRV
jgi:hypothetical protein